ncbi:MAG: outer membrane beta-barrel protein [Candidatus Acidiferrales bacterium]
MKRWGLLCGVILLFSIGASAQDEAPKVEAFGGYSYVRVNPGVNRLPGLNFNGGSGSLAYNFTPTLGVVADFGGYHWSQGVVDATVVSYLFGPKVALRHGPITPFAQILFGGVHGSGSVSGVVLCDARVRPQGTSQCTVSGSENAFAMTAGGGVDWNATTHIGIRLIQAEYLMTRFFSETQNNARISAGVVFRF